MNEMVKSINMAFGNCVFSNRDPKAIEDIISTRVNDPNKKILPMQPKAIKVETIDDLHDKLLLLCNDANVEGIITWRLSVNGKYYVFSKFE